MIQALLGTQEPRKATGPFLRSLKCLKIGDQQIFVKWVNESRLQSSTVQGPESSLLSRAQEVPGTLVGNLARLSECDSWSLNGRVIRRLQPQPTGRRPLFHVVCHLFTKTNPPSWLLAH